VGRVVENGTDEDQARAGRMDHWIAWEAEERMGTRGGAEAEFDIFSFFLFCSGGLIPRTAHAEGEGSPLLW